MSFPLSKAWVGGSTGCCLPLRKEGEDLTAEMESLFVEGAAWQKVERWKWEHQTKRPRSSVTLATWDGGGCEKIRGRGCGVSDNSTHPMKSLVTEAKWLEPWVQCFGDLVVSFKKAVFYHNVWPQHASWFLEISMVVGSRHLGFKCWLCHLPALWPRTSYLTCENTHFLIPEKEIIVSLNSESCCED